MHISLSTKADNMNMNEQFFIVIAMICIKTNSFLDKNFMHNLINWPLRN